MALAPVPNPGSQIERAVIAHLQWAFDQCAVARPNFYFSNDWRTRAVPLIDVLAHKSDEQPIHSRGESYQVRIEFKWPGANQPGEQNTEINWLSINQMIGAVMAGMSLNQPGNGLDSVATVTADALTAAGQALAVDQTDGADPAAKQFADNNADMASFVCDYVQFTGSVRAEAGEGGIWLKEIRNFEIRAYNT